MDKKLNKIVRIIFVVLIVANLISYQFLFAINMARAEDGTLTATETVSEEKDASSDSKDETKSETETQTETTETKEAPVSEPQPVNNISDAGQQSSGTDAVPAETQTAAGSAVDPVVGTTPENIVESNKPDCDCSSQNNSANCDNADPSKCSNNPCDCGSQVTNSNTAGDTSNTTDSESVTGGNSIVSATVPENEPDKPAEDGQNNEENKESTDENHAPDSSGPASIGTGNATVSASSVSETNTNIVTDNGQEITQNIIGNYVGDIDLTEAFNNVLDSAKDLNQQNQEAFEHVTVTNINVAENIENTTVANADSGNNTIENSSGKTTITTGSAEATASAINFINTNIVGNNWLLAVINIVGNWTGDLIVPGEGVFQTSSGQMVFDKVVNSNIAENIKNFILGSANTGGNTIDDQNGSAGIQTGNATSGSQGVDMVNTNIVNNNWFFLMINNSGNWIGRVINWDKEKNSQNTVFEYDFGSLESEQDAQKVVSVFNYNTAENITNSVIATANTGNNEISADGKASIKTGNASAWASAINFINTNIVGNNWFFGLVNNTGTWKGNVVFANPDLAVSIHANKKMVRVGDTLNYTITYKNIGQVKSAGVDLLLSLPGNMKFLSGSLGNPNGDGSNLYWSVSGLKPGQEKSFKVNLKLDENVSISMAKVSGTIGIRSMSAESNLANNFATINTEISRLSQSEIMIMEGSAKSLKESDLDVKRSDDQTVVMGNVANHSIMVTNSGKHTLFNLIVSEKINEPSGGEVVEYQWPISELRRGQTAYIQYQIMLDQTALAGAYKHKASAVGYDEYSNEIKSGSATGIVNLMKGAFISSPAAPEIPAPVIPEESSSLPLPKSVLGLQTASGNDTPWGWLAALALLPIVHIIRKKELYRWENLQRVAKYASGFLSSFFW
jgi:uncharacterized repeat protein (TIGR01451 family)